MHFLRKDEARQARAIGRLYAAVEARIDMVGHYKKRVLTIGKICVLKADAIMVPLPKDVEVVDPSGRLVRPSGTFLVTTESFNPCHLVTDWRGEPW